MACHVSFQGLPSTSNFSLLWYMNGDCFIVTPMLMIRGVVDQCVDLLHMTSIH
ncbi:hypothetical protein MKX01_013133 [Papaver californicum]|nr:hypothetical protein MKX01_013133 [Papaver californicum]